VSAASVGPGVVNLGSYSSTGGGYCGQIDPLLATLLLTELLRIEPWHTVMYW
jgi:hypothetical protein